MDNHKGVLVFGETLENKLAPITIELLGIGRRLANELNEELSILFLGNRLEFAAKEAIAYGAEKVYISEDSILETYNPDAYTQLTTNFCKKILPSIILLGYTDIGCDLAPRLNARLGGALSMDCSDLSIDPNSKFLIMTRPIYGGNAYAKVVSKSARPQIATIRPKIAPPAKRNDSRQGQIINLEEKIDPAMIRVKTIERVKEEVEGIKLEEAEVVIGGGHGIGSAQNFEMLKELASLLGGAVGATRRACDEGWVPTTLQIGQTGKVISPKIYIAIALSGAMSHIVGCLGSKYIVAINKDPEANIFNVAHYGIVADYKEVLPSLTAKLKELLSK